MFYSEMSDGSVHCNRCQSFSLSNSCFVVSSSQHVLLCCDLLLCVFIHYMSLEVVSTLTIESDIKEDKHTVKCISFTFHSCIYGFGKAWISLTAAPLTLFLHVEKSKAWCLKRFLKTSFESQLIFADVMDVQYNLFLWGWPFSYYK